MIKKRFSRIIIVLLLAVIIALSFSSCVSVKSKKTEKKEKVHSFVSIKNKNFKENKSITIKPEEKIISVKSDETGIQASEKKKIIEQINVNTKIKNINIVETDTVNILNNKKIKPENKEEKIEEKRYSLPPEINMTRDKRKEIITAYLVYMAKFNVTKPEDDTNTLPKGKKVTESSENENNEYMLIDEIIEGQKAISQLGGVIDGLIADEKKKVLEKQNLEVKKLNFQLDEIIEHERNMTTLYKEIDKLMTE